MKILEVCHYAPNYGGNFIASITDLMQVVRQERPETEFLFVFPEAAKAKLWCQDLMKEHRVYFAGFGFGKINRILCKICKEEKIDIMHLHFTQKNCAILSKLLTKTKILYHVHYTQHSKGLRQKIKNLLSNLLYIPTLDLLIGCSEAVKDSLVKAGIPAKKCDFVNNGVDFPQLDRIKQSHPFDDGKNSLLLLGTHYFRKGLDLAVMAIEPIVEKYNILLQVPSHVPEETMAFVKSVLGKEVDWVKNPSYNGQYRRLLSCVCNIFISFTRRRIKLCGDGIFILQMSCNKNEYLFNGLSYRTRG